MTTGARGGSHSGGRLTTGQRSLLAAGEKDGSSGTHGWQVAVPESVKEGLWAGQGYEIEFLPRRETHVYEAVTPMNTAPEIYSFLVEKEWIGKQLDPERLPMHKEVFRGM